MEPVTVGQIVGLMSNPDTVMITEGSRIIFAGFVGIMLNHCPEYEAVKECQVKRLTIKTDITHKEWKERGLISPLKPDELPQYSFADLQITVYRKIEI